MNLLIDHCPLVLDIHLDTQRSEKRYFPISEPNPHFVTGAYLGLAIRELWIDKEPFLILVPGALSSIGAPGTQRILWTYISPLDQRLMQLNLEADPFLLQFFHQEGISALLIRGESPYPVSVLLQPGSPQFIPYSSSHRKMGLQVTYELKHRDNIPGNYQAIQNHYQRILAPGSGLGAAWNQQKLGAILLSSSTSFVIPPLRHKIVQDIHRLIAANPVLLGEFGFHHFGTGAVFDILFERGLLQFSPVNHPFRNIPSLLENQSTHCHNECVHCPVQCYRYLDSGTPVPDLWTLICINRIYQEIQSVDFLSLYQQILTWGLDPFRVTESLLEQQGSSPWIQFLEMENPTHWPVWSETRKNHYVGTISHLIKIERLLPTAFALSTSPFGDYWMTSYLWTCELLRKPFPLHPLSLTGITPIGIQHENFIAVLDILGICPLLSVAIGIEEVTNLIHTVLTTNPISGADLLEMGAKFTQYRHRMQNPSVFASIQESLQSYLASKLILETREQFQSNVQQYHRLRGKIKSPTPVQVVPMSYSGFKPIIERIESAGLAPSTAITLAIREEAILSSGTHSQIAAELLQVIPVQSILIIQPALPYRIAANDLSKRYTVIAPNDSETRTLLHQIPILASNDLSTTIQYLKQYRVIWHTQYGFITTGPHILEQAYLAFSCAANSFLIQYILDALYEVQREPLPNDYIQGLRTLFSSIPEPPPIASIPILSQKPSTPQEILQTIDCTGKETVRLRLVDSYFGNISCLDPSRENLYISRTGAALDELKENIVVCNLSHRSCSGMIASSEFTAHRSVLTQTGDRCLLHAHPIFTIIISMFCPEFPVCEYRDGCHIRCHHLRNYRSIPIITGEVGTGPYGLCHTLPPAMQHHPEAIVYGHGIFLRHPEHFLTPLQRLRQIEIAARHDIIKMLKLSHPSRT